MRQIYSRLNPFKSNTLEAHSARDHDSKWQVDRSSNNRRHLAEEGVKAMGDEETTGKPKEAREPKERLEVRCNPPLLIRGYSDTVAEGR